MSPSSDDDLPQFRRVLRARMQRAYDSRHEAESLANNSPEDLEIGWESLAEAVSTARSSHALVGQLPPQPPTVRGRIGGLLVKIVQRILFWYTPQVVRFQYAAVEALEKQNRALQRLGESLMGRVAEQNNEIVEMKVQIEHLKLQQTTSVTEEKHPSEETQQNWGNLYLALEDRFRGTPESIKENLRFYLPRIASIGASSNGTTLLDLGCGRGEWLELLREHGIDAVGVDSNPIMVSHCRQGGLTVYKADALQFLRSQPEASYDAITAFHVIEHLPLPALIEFLDGVLRALKPHGIAIFETPNPNNFQTASRDFYYDPTHRHPIPTLLGQFLAEARGFRDVEILELHPWPESTHVPAGQCAEIAARWNAVFHGPQDYAIIGVKE